MSHPVFIRFRSLWSTLLLLLFAGALLCVTGCARTTPTEAAALTAAVADHTAYVLPPDTLAKAESLSRIRTFEAFAGPLWDIVQLWLLLQLGIVARMRNVAVNLSKNRWAQSLVFLLELIVVLTLLNLPLSLFSQHERIAYGLSVQGWVSWFGDLVKSNLIALVLGWPLLMLLFLLIRKFPRRWWLVTWAVACCLVVVGVFASPYVIDPLFNKFEPLQNSNPALVAKLQQVVARGKGIDIPPSRMFLMKASAKTTTLNAYVTGFGASKRVVVWDTSVARFSPDEIALVFGHEMGHYVLGHIVFGVLFSFTFLFVIFGIGFYALRWLLRTRGKQWRVPAQDNWAALVVIMLVFSVLSFFASPVFNAFSRMDEHAADVFGLEAVHGIDANPQEAGQRAFDVLGINSLVAPDPNPFVEWWTGSHPPIYLRAAFSRHYDPWAPGSAPKYFTK